MKQIDWIEELDKKNRQERFKEKYWRDQEGRSRYNNWKYYSTSAANGSWYKVYNPNASVYRAYSDTTAS